MWFHDDLHEAMRENGMKYKVGDRIRIGAYGKGQGDGFAPLLDGRMAEIVAVDEESRCYMVRVPSLANRKCENGWHIPERYAEDER